jgi:hypothetical protein
MRYAPIVVAMLLLFAACAPATIEPLQSEELVSTAAYSDTYAAVVNVINTQPYPADSGGWIITDSDQVGGFIAAQLNGTRCLFGCTPYVARVSIALVERSDGTAINISQNRHEEALKLSQRIRERLGI